MLTRGRAPSWYKHACSAVMEHPLVSVKGCYAESHDIACQPMVKSIKTFQYGFYYAHPHIYWPLLIVSWHWPHIHWHPHTKVMMPPWVHPVSPVNNIWDTQHGWMAHWWRHQ
jgi:hypothetical protein